MHLSFLPEVEPVNQLMNQGRFMRRAVSLCCVFALISGCAGGPRSVNASLPLVSGNADKPTQQAVPSTYWEGLADAQQRQLTHPDYAVTLGPLYASALGLVCREVTFAAAGQGRKQRVACEHHYVGDDEQPVQGWFLEKEIVESRYYVEL